MSFHSRVRPIPDIRLRRGVPSPCPWWAMHLTDLLCSCRHYAFFRQLLLIINQVVVCCMFFSYDALVYLANMPPVILFLRTFALYGRDWRVGGSVFAFAMALLGISCVRSDVVLHSKHGTHQLITDISGLLSASTRTSSFEADAIWPQTA